MIKLKVINIVTSTFNKFYECASLSPLPDFSKWNISDISYMIDDILYYDMRYMLGGWLNELKMKIRAQIKSIPDGDLEIFIFKI